MLPVVGGLGPHEQLVVLNNLLECEKLVHILISTSKQVVHLGRFEILGKSLKISIKSVSCHLFLGNVLVAGDDPGHDLLLGEDIVLVGVQLVVEPVLLLHQPVLVLVLTPDPDILLEAQLAILVCVFLF